MTVIVTDAGFGADDFTGEFTPLDQAVPMTTALDIASSTAPEALHISPAVTTIRIDFPSFADGRGFTLARLLRLRGFTGRLRARGHVIADQYAMARRSGFDEVEISDDLATRQPVEQWVFRADWRAHDYQSRLRA